MGRVDIFELHLVVKCHCTLVVRLAHNALNAVEPLQDVRGIMVINSLYVPVERGQPFTGNRFQSGVMALPRMILK